MTSHTLYFDNGEQVAQAACHSLSHFGYVLKLLHIEGTRQSHTQAVKLLNNKETKIYFHQKGHQFKPCECGYRREETEEGIRLVSRDSRLVLEPSDFWPCINRSPFQTPMVIEWAESIHKAAKGVYCKPLSGFNQTGEYLDPALTPARLDALVCAMVKRKVLAF